MATLEELADAIQKSQQCPNCVGRYVPLSDRIALLCKAVVNLENFLDELRETITKEMGKVSLEATLEVDDAIELQNEWLDLILEANQDFHPGGGGEDKSESVIVCDPFVVVVVFSPWNFLVGEIPLVVLPALAAGNAVIVKLSEVTPPRCGALVCQAMSDELPDGILNVVHGDGDVGAKQLKRVVLELGDKDPMIVFADAISVILTGVSSMVLFGTKFNILHFWGIGNVICAVCCFIVLPTYRFRSTALLN
jgi:acyl-CoA reductase-like NAD-dependent aldehyde dehydrogenase